MKKICLLDGWCNTACWWILVVETKFHTTNELVHGGHTCKALDIVRAAQQIQPLTSTFGFPGLLKYVALLANKPMILC